MQPRRCPSGCVFSVTNAPARTLKLSGTANVGKGRRRTRLSTASLAIFTARRPSSSAYDTAYPSRRSFLNVPGRSGDVVRTRSPEWERFYRDGPFSTLHGGEGPGPRVGDHDEDSRDGLARGHRGPRRRDDADPRHREPDPDRGHAGVREAGARRGAPRDRGPLRGVRHVLDGARPRQEAARLPGLPRRVTVPDWKIIGILL